MCRGLALVVSAAMLVGSLGATAAAQQSRPLEPQSGRLFQAPETQRQEDDEGANPGYLWVEQGATLWSTPPATGNGRACMSCHGEARTTMRGVAAHYPAIDPPSGGLLNLELRINRCRTVHQSTPLLTWESNELLALTAYISQQSKGLPRSVAIDGAARAHFESGRAFFHERQGQLNLACTQCHDDHVGRRLRGDRISQGQTDGWPAYRLDWQTLGSLGRRIRACNLGVRAQLLDHGAPEMVALELYLAWRGQGLPVSSPGVRR